MSLRSFHIVFVTVCTLLCAFFAVWAFVFAADRSGVITALGVIGAIGTLGMPVYGVYFYRKARNILL
jgi:multidrug transporter EmrE-like cation transporter